MKHIHIPKKTYSKMSSLINQPQFNSHYITAILGEVLLENRAGGAISDQLHLIRIWMLKQNIPLDLYSKCRFPFVLIIAYKSYHHRPQVKTINHSTQLIIQINRQGIICTSSTVIENNAASASIQFESGQR